jgi:amino acid transporter
MLVYAVMTIRTAEDREERHRLTAFEGIAALSLDALSSVAYGPQAIVIVLAAAGAAALEYTVPVTIAIVILLAVLVVSYRQVIEAFPTGGGAYAVASRHLGRQASLLAAASLIVDYVLNAAVGVSAGVAALWSAFPALYGARVWLCLAVLALITGVNLWGVAESARVFIVPTVAFIIAIAIVIIGGAVRSQPVVTLAGQLPPVTESVGILLLLKAFASGCSALTGVEAIANAVPEFKKPRVRRAQHTEMWLGVLLGVMLLGISVLIRKFHLAPSATETTLAQLTAAAVGKNFLFYAIQLITTVLLALAANTSFGGLPVLASLLARDNNCRTCSGCARTGRCTGTGWWCWRFLPRSCSWWPRGTPRPSSRCSRSACSWGSRCLRRAWSGTGASSTGTAGPSARSSTAWAPC